MAMEHAVFAILAVFNAMDHYHQIVKFAQMVKQQKGSLLEISVFVPIHILMITEIKYVKLVHQHV